MPSGSIACFNARITTSACSPSSVFKYFIFPWPDAVLARAGAFHGKGPLGEPVEEALGPGDLRLIIHVDQ